MKSLLLLATLTLAASASASETAKTQSSPLIAPAPDMNLYAAFSAPEPSHAMLLMMGCVGLAVRRRR